MGLRGRQAGKVSSDQPLQSGLLGYTANCLGRDVMECDSAFPSTCRSLLHTAATPPSRPPVQPLMLLLFTKTTDHKHTHTERERDRDRNRQTDRQTETQTDRQTDRLDFSVPSTTQGHFRPTNLCHKKLFSYVNHFSSEIYKINPYTNIRRVSAFNIAFAKKKKKKMTTTNKTKQKKRRKKKADTC